MAINFSANKELCDRVGKNIKMIRLEKGLTQSEVSRKLGLSGNKTISRWEAGLVDITISQLVAIMDCYGVRDWTEILD
jgi:transcriptional regulator with XRE-family HTH domain